MSSWDWVIFANTAVAALLGTAVGATVAFWIENAKREQRLQDERVSATNIAIFNLANAWSALEVFRKDRIEPVRAVRTRWYSLTAGEITFTLPELNVSGLAFLFESIEPDLPAQVQLEFTRFEHIRLEVENRTEIHVRQLQPKTEASLRGQLKVDEQTLIEVVGPRLHQTLVHQTDDIIKTTDEALPSIQATARRLREVVKALYPNRKVIGFEPKNNDRPSTQPESAEHNGMNLKDVTWLPSTVQTIVTGLVGLAGAVIGALATGHVQLQVEEHKDAVATQQRQDDKAEAIISLVEKTPQTYLMVKRTMLLDPSHMPTVPDDSERVVALVTLYFPGAVEAARAFEARCGEHIMALGEVAKHALRNEPLGSSDQETFYKMLEAGDAVESKVIEALGKSYKRREPVTRAPQH